MTCPFSPGILALSVVWDLPSPFSSPSRSGGPAAVLLGVVAYFPALVGVPTARLFRDLGVGLGPLVACILADRVRSGPQTIHVP